MNKNTIAKAKMLINIEVPSVLKTFVGAIKFKCLKFTNEFQVKSNNIEANMAIPTPKMLKYLIKTKFKTTQTIATSPLIAVST